MTKLVNGMTHTKEENRTQDLIVSRMKKIRMRTSSLLHFNASAQKKVNLLSIGVIYETRRKLEEDKKKRMSPDRPTSALAMAWRRQLTPAAAATTVNTRI
ncbi:unnamed protein product [Anisakis simplex]|uniref:Uncharacterized protein n=1 Tax=Anisakis simplex TaxID=6269 RepID=A0A0M3K2I2_ANISI|nr:unnamed protein product [Anisakis simplex]